MGLYRFEKGTAGLRAGAMQRLWASI